MFMFRNAADSPPTLCKQRKTFFNCIHRFITPSNPSYSLSLLFIVMLCATNCMRARVTAFDTLFRFESVLPGTPRLWEGDIFRYFG